MYQELYYRNIKREVLAAIKRGVADLSMICRHCQGAFPTDVVSVIADLAASGEITVPRGLLSSTHKVWSSNWPFPEPHLLDYDWRFTKKTAERIAEYVKHIGHKIACLGTPTVFKLLAEQGCDVYLFDRNPFLNFDFHTCSKSRFVVCDLQSSLFTSIARKFDVLVLDPPWYPEHYMPWLRRSLELADEKAKIILTLFPELIRPNALSERLDILNLLNAIGETSLLTLTAEYETPLFEWETLRASNVPLLPNWRTADIFRVDIKSIPNFPEPNIAPQNTWDRFLFNTQLIALKRIHQQKGHFHIDSVYTDGSFTLRSVSTRDPIRNNIHLWTSRNRCFQVNGIDELREFFHIFASSASFQTATQKLGIGSPNHETLLKLLNLIELNSYSSGTTHA